MMYLLDTNVISELRKIESGRVNRRVEAWVDSVDAELFFLPVVTVLELETGALLLERRDLPQARMLQRWINDLILPSFAGRILPIDLPIALRCAAMHVPNRRPDRDGWIAATALVHGMTVVTRNVADFQHMGVAVLNPWVF
jgi:predicted nucleic acid-binding protein